MPELRAHDYKNLMRSFHDAESVIPPPFGCGRLLQFFDQVIVASAVAAVVDAELLLQQQQHCRDVYS